MDIQETLRTKAYNALARAYAPYSHFTVAACLYTDQGNFYTGVNIENASYSLTLCAEAAAIACMVSAGEQRIQEILILSGDKSLCPPCGACRQRICEFASAHTPIHLCTNDHITATIALAELLPLAFNFTKIG